MPLSYTAAATQAATFLNAFHASPSMRRTMALICCPGPSSTSCRLPPASSDPRLASHCTASTS